MSLVFSGLEADLFPDWLIRWGIRGLLWQRLREENQGGVESRQARLSQLRQALSSGAIALETQAANQQHYEVPTRFFELVLGPHRKYSSGYWPEGVTTLAESEASMLRLTCERAQLQDGQKVLDLGCGWGALALWMAEHYPHSEIVGVSNSRTQKAFIEAQAQSRGLPNVRILTADMNTLELDERFDRVVSVEMMEHMRNHKQLLQKIAGWLLPEGQLFVHIFTHHHLAYLFEVKGASDWMAQYFFTGGMMPSADWLFYFQEHLQLKEHWRVNGQHYQKTCEAWLSQMDRQAQEVRPLLAQTYGAEALPRWWVYWRVFFMACAELFGYHGGNEWFVSHYRFQKRDR